jgi:peptidoglycan/xylan/chitin deacetylase (PgdA/CDA1 family)
VYATTTWQRVERKLAKVLNRKTFPMRNAGGIVSFSFDDVPASACRAGLAVLKKNGARGTFYVCGLFTDTVTPEGEMHSYADLKNLVADGHEVGSHGFAHLNYQNLSIQKAQEDIEANRTFFDENGMDGAGVTFAYPFGCARPSSKALIVREFACARSTDVGINVKTMDVGLLKAVPLYDRRTNQAAVSAWLEKTFAESGWLIFYTHDVCESAGLYGCSPQLLEFAVNQSRQLGLTVLPVRDAVRRAIGEASQAPLL